LIFPTVNLLSPLPKAFTVILARYHNPSSFLLPFVGFAKMPRRNHNRRAGRRQQNNQQVSAQIKPPQIKTNVIFRHKFRYICTASSSFTVNPVKLAAACGSICTVVNSVCTLLYDSLRIRSIECWSPAPSQGTASTATVLWNQLSAGISNMSSIEVSDTSMSTAYPAHVKCRPPKESFASNWTSAASTTPNLMTLSLATGTVVDLDVELILGDTGASGPTATVVTGVLGTVYYLPLDGTSSHNCIPVQLSTTF
jgi:hypothetical protein